MYAASASFCEGVEILVMTYARVCVQQVLVFAKVWDIGDKYA